MRHGAALADTNLTAIILNHPNQQIGYLASNGNTKANDRPICRSIETGYLAE